MLAVFKAYSFKFFEENWVTESKNPLCAVKLCWQAEDYYFFVIFYLINTTVAIYKNIADSLKF